MIARGLSSGSICLGCRLRLLRQVTRPNLARSQSPSPTTQRPHARQWFASEAPARPSRPSQELDDHVWSSLEQASVSEEQAYHSFLQEEDAIPDFDEFPNTRPRQRPRPPPREREENFRAVRHLDLRKRHLSGLKILTETTESLGSDMLGKPAFAIVMRDGGRYKAKKPQAYNDKPELSDQRRETLDIEALLDRRLKPATEAEARENINELRPPESEIYLQAKDFQKIQLGLEEGFLKEQLADYLANFKTEDNAQHQTDRITSALQSEEAQLSSQYQWISRVVPWLPLTPNGKACSSDHPLGRILHAYLRPRASPKARAAVRIMRGCWGLQIEEIANGPGELRVSLHDEQFMPLMRGARRFIRSVTNKYLEEGETIEVLEAANEIRIVAPRYKCQTILTEIDDLIARIKTHTFPISHVTADASKLTGELLEQVGRVTNTHAQLTKTGNRFQVAWIQTSSPSDSYETESLAHVVFRFLQNALQPDPATRTLHTTVADVVLGSDNGSLVVDHSKKDKWAWKDRFTTWARLVAPVSEPQLEIEAADATSVTASIPTLSMSVERPQLAQQNAQGSVEELEQSLKSPSSPLPEGLALQEVSSFPYQPVRWSSNLDTTTSAVFGHILSSYSKESPARPNTTDLAIRPYNFSPIVPHPISLAELSAPSPEHNEKNLITPGLPFQNTILIRFLHNPNSAARAFPLVAPILELRLSVSEPTSPEEDPEITDVHSLRAITATHHTDIILPTNAVDLRITQNRSASLQGSPGALAAWQPIDDFLSRSRLDLGAGKLDMADSQRFQIPLHLFGEAPAAKRGEGKKRRLALQHEASAEVESETEQEQTQLQQGCTPNAIRSTLYEFAGLELHRSVTVPYPEDQRCSLVYTSIEAGQGGGRRAELSLRPAAASVALPSREAGGGIAGAELDDDYVRACYKLAQTAKHWSGRSLDLKL